MFCPLLLQGQNLVPNFSFEDTARRVTPLFLPAEWYAATNEGFNYLTPLNNTIPQHALFAAPSNVFGYQKANTGQAYLGFNIYYVFKRPSDGVREYAQVKLNRTLVQDSTYCLQLFVSLADSSRFASRGQLAVYFSDTAFKHNTYSDLPFSPQIVVSPTDYIDEKVDWMEFNFEYKATGGEAYLTLGNFNDTTSIDTLGVGGGDPNNINFYSTYYYVDDVWLSHCDSIRDSIIGIKEQHLKSQLSLYPNPFRHEFEVISKQNKALSFQMYNRLGQQVGFRFKRQTNNYTFQVGDIPRGIYLLQISDGIEQTSFKLIKE